MHLEVFDGPLDLLLTLIQRESLDISTVALAQVTDQYLAFLATLEIVDPAALADFCEVASTLIVIKSRALLPRPPVVAEVEQVDAEALVERLRNYRRFKRVAEELGERERAGVRAFARIAPPPDLPPILDAGGVSAVDLASAFQSALAEAAAAAAAAAAGSPVAAAPAPHPVRLADRLLDIRTLLIARGGRLSFREVLLGERTDREYVIVSFLAVLELLRRQAIRAVQAELFGEIFLEARTDVQEDVNAEMGFVDP